MITEDVIVLKQEFERIKKMGYVKSTRSGFTGIGKTFEDLIGKEEDTLEAPDFRGIEIKTKRGYSKGYTTLFCATPQGKGEFETKRISNAYGYPDKILKDKEVLANSVQANYPTLVAGHFAFKLQIDYEKEKIYLVIKDRNGKLLEKDVYWDFSTIQEKLERKMKVLAFIKAWPNRIDGVDYYKYYDIKFYQLKGFEEFLKLIEQGVIRITFKIGVFRQGERMGEVHDRGTGFEIEEINLTKLFNPIEI